MKKLPAEFRLIVSRNIPEGIWDVADLMKDVNTKPEVRKSIVMKEKRCFICLSASHRAGECKKKWKCFKCGGRHNFAICTFKN